MVALTLGCGNICSSLYLSEAGMHDLTEFENMYHRYDPLHPSHPLTVTITTGTSDMFFEHLISRFKPRDEEHISSISRSNPVWPIGSTSLKCDGVTARLLSAARYERAYLGAYFDDEFFVSGESPYYVPFL